MSDVDVNIPFVQHGDLVVAAVLLLTCTHRDGRGHRFTVNCTGATNILRTTQQGAKCLNKRGKIEPPA